MSKFKCGEIVKVSREVFADKNKIDEGRFYYIQRFVVKYKDIYYCAKDSGAQDRLVGWHKCEKNVDNLRYYGE